MTSKVYGDSGKDLRAIANFVKKLCTNLIIDETLEGLACRLVPLEKRSGIRPIGARKVLRRIC